MTTLLKVYIVLFILVFSTLSALAVSPSASEIKMAQEFMQSALISTNPNLPFSFVYGSKPSDDLLFSWKVEQQTHELDSSRTERTTTYTDRQTGLVVKCVAVRYSDFPVVEWTLYFKNTGKQDTPIIADIQALNTEFKHGEKGEFLLHHANGSQAQVNDFQPLLTQLPPKSDLSITSQGGRPSNGAMPYFNVEWPEAGVILAVGWPGQWKTRFICDATNTLRVYAGQELTHFKLHPGEEVRSPLIALLFYEGGWLRSQNLWRQWMVAYNLPHVDGEPLRPAVFACSSHQFGEMVRANEQNQEQFIKRYLHEGLKIDYWWMDAGWYVNDGSWVNTGTWEVDPKRFPHGLRAISDYARVRGIKTLLWFEPERVTTNSWLYEKHPEWLLTPPPNPGGQAYQMDWRLLNLGDPDARDWLINHVDHIIKSQRIGVYRQDFNIDPLYFWRAHDEPDRQGITEIKYVTGYLEYWDELKRRNPKLLFDSCASGGRRLDLETMRRSVPRTRSDYLFEPVGEQSHTYGLAFWLPYYGTGCMDAVTDQETNNHFYGSLASHTDEAYFFRSELNPVMIWSSDVSRKDLHYDVLRKLLAQWKEVSPNMLGDYYPLTPYSTAQNEWIAWQFDRPDLGVGMVQVFRRSENTRKSVGLKLCGLNVHSRYTVTNLDVDGSKIYTGRQLMDEGLHVAIPEQPGAVILTYKKMD